MLAEFVIIVLYSSKPNSKLAHVDELIVNWHLPLLKALEDPNFSESFQLRDALQKHIENHSLKFFDQVTKKNRNHKQRTKEVIKCAYL